MAKGAVRVAEKVIFSTRFHLWTWQQTASSVRVIFWHFKLKIWLSAFDLGPVHE